MDACDAWGLEIAPPFTSESLSAVPEGVVEFVAAGPQTLSPHISLTVSEFWLPGPDPQSDRRLEAEGCHLTALSWHIQIGKEGDAECAERLDVIEEADADHPRIHRHPYGSPNDLRVAAELPPPAAWLHRANDATGGLLSAGLETWGDEDME